MSVDIHQPYRFKMNVKLSVDNLVFIRIIQMAITDIRIGISSPNFPRQPSFSYQSPFQPQVDEMLWSFQVLFETWYLLKGLLWLFCFCHFAGKILEYFFNFGLNIYEQLPQLVFQAFFFLVKLIWYQKSIQRIIIQQGKHFLQMQKITIVLQKYSTSTRNSLETKP